MDLRFAQSVPAIEITKNARYIADSETFGSGMVYYFDSNLNEIGYITFNIPMKFPFPREWSAGNLKKLAIYEFNPLTGSKVLVDWSVLEEVYRKGETS